MKSENSLIDRNINIPVHIAIIMDGNGRWAKKRALPRSAGHAAGSKNFKTIARYCNKIGVKYLTVYAFSTENWNRPKEEVDALMNLFRDYLKDTKKFIKENIALKFIGNKKGLAKDIIELMEQAEYDSRNATGLTVNLAINYGGRDEITEAVKEIAELVKNNKINIEDINEQTIENHLFTKNVPDPDLVIRPSGEYRSSNFLIWQSAYAEYWFSDILWPDFKPRHLMKAIEDFNKRNRRFGGV